MLFRSVGEVLGDPGRVVVCVPKSSDVATLFTEGGPAVLTAKAVQALIDLLVEAKALMGEAC